MLFRLLKQQTGLRRPRREGSTAIEFAMVAMPFLLFLFGILEIGLLLLLDAVVETATSDTARVIRTGQAQQQVLTPEDIKRRLCANMSIFSADCDKRAHIDIRVVDGFATPLAPDPLESGTFNKDVLTYAPGGPRDHVLVRIWYEHRILTPFMARALTKSKDGKVMLTTALAFKNEPYL